MADFMMFSDGTLVNLDKVYCVIPYQIVEGESEKAYLSFDGDPFDEPTAYIFEWDMDGKYNDELPYSVVRMQGNGLHLDISYLQAIREIEIHCHPERCGKSIVSEKRNSYKSILYWEKIAKKEGKK